MGLEGLRWCAMGRTMQYEFYGLVLRKKPYCSQQPISF
jgi:hypothetical protein